MAAHKKLVMINALMLGGEVNLQVPNRLSFYEGGREYVELWTKYTQAQRIQTTIVKNEVYQLKEYDTSFTVTDLPPTQYCPICDIPKPDGTIREMKQATIEITETSEVL